MKREKISYGAILLSVVISLHSFNAVAQSSETVLNCMAQLDVLFEKNEALRQERNQCLKTLPERSDPGSSSTQVLEAENDKLLSELESAKATIEQLRQLQSRMEAREKAASDRETTLLEQLDAAENERKGIADQLLATRQQFERERAELSERAIQAEDRYERCQSDKEQACTAVTSQCKDVIDTTVMGILATIKVTNECRKNEQLTVRARKSTLLPARMVTNFDNAGLAELIFPVLDENTQLRIMGATAESNQDLSLSPQENTLDDFVVLRWEDELVDLNLVVSHGASNKSVSVSNRQESFGEITLAQDSASLQNPRFELFTSTRGAPVLDLLVSHANLTDRAIAPFCGEAEAATPTFLLMMKDRNGFRQVREEISSIPCGQQILPNSGYFLPNRFIPD